MNGDGMVPILPVMSMVVPGQHMIQQNAPFPMAQMPSQIGTNLSAQPYSTPQNPPNGESNGSKKTPKEKTPMCQVNEIAKFNKLAPKYTLTGEEGPPHHKTFTVTLELGPGEKYEGSGTSIKKAQHSAAKKAIENCQTLERPKYKPKRPKQINYDALTPTVKLNGLAMKRGEMAHYKMVDRKPIFHNNQSFNPQFSDGMPQIYPNANPKRINTRPPKLFVVELTVGEKVFHAEGRTRQQAKHSAATQALEYYERNPAPEKVPKPAQSGQPIPPGEQSQPKKSEVSLVYELALKRNLTVQFEKISEEGPPHLKHYSIRLHVGNPEEQEDNEQITYFTAEGQAQSKKLARRKAAITVLDEMRRLIESEEREKPLSKGKGRNKKKSNVIKETEKQSPDISLHPVSRLAQIQQAAKEREPIYQVISEKSVQRKKEFIMQCIVNDKVSQGIGPNKKTAKKIAAEAMLVIMGHEPSVGDCAEEGKPSKAEGKNESAALPKMAANPSGIAQATILPNSAAKAGQVNEPQLNYLASLQGFSVSFTDFPKDGQFLSLVSIGTTPPIVAHGQGASVALAHEEAAAQALKALITRGLENSSG